MPRCRRYHADRYSGAGRERNRRQRQSHGGRQAVADFIDDGAPASDRRSQITAERILDELDVLQRQRPVQPEFRPEARHRRTRCELPEHDHDGVARGQVKHQKSGHADADERGDEQEEPPQQKRGHPARPRRWAV
jgi:hypothetical protein